MNKNMAAEIAGWYGIMAILLAYTLVSFNVVPSDGIWFQLLNLTGALGIIVIALHKHVLQSVVLNVFWAAIAIIALTRILLS